MVKKIAKTDKKVNKKKRMAKWEKEGYEKMKELGLEGILDEISKVDTQRGISMISALLLNPKLSLREEF